ncbi:two-component system, OmpR family, sensor histidine kinase MprB [Prauserella alba]|uniref:histidine kinase n=2 Tax=Prauserella alba TaxID=176898 RepID=A0ABP4FT21_9PSEU|nr:two-component system, OmpR family, sensor histidine kinase MprB [Prauserella alba]
MTGPAQPGIGSADGISRDGAGPERTPKRISLRTRVMLLATLCVGGTVALVSLVTYLTVRDNVYEQFDSSLTQRAHAAAQSVPVASQFQNLPAALFASGDIQIGLLEADDTLVAPRGAAKPPTSEAELAVARGGAEWSLRTDKASGIRVVAVQSGRGQALVLGQSLAQTERTLGDLALVLMLFGGIGVVVAAGAATAVARTALRPVERLTSATERVADTMDLRPIPVTGDDELSRMTQSFNTMLGAVAESQAQQSRLVADASHELRTPLTSLRTNLELLLSAGRSGAPQLDETMRSEIEADIRGQLDELTQLIGDLVELARDSGPQEMIERVDLAEVVERALDRARRRAGDTEFDVRLESWELTGDPGVLERAVLNLLDNAVKFSPAGGTVHVGLRPLGDGTAVVEVADRGPGIASEDLPRVFDRFYRSAEARTLPGSGLGLAIVRQAAQRHGGGAFALSREGGGTIMTIRLPGRTADPDE